MKNPKGMEYWKIKNKKNKSRSLITKLRGFKFYEDISKGVTIQSF
jgi:hypothetical protein